MKKIMMTQEEWRALLKPKVFEVTRGAGTEPPFDNAYWDEKREGIYKCANCCLNLFNSENKFDSGTGWPSFWKSFAEENIEIVKDTSHGMMREEALCGRCGSHLGHLFHDGPKPTRLRYCMNSAALEFVEKK